MLQRLNEGSKNLTKELREDDLLGMKDEVGGIAAIMLACWERAHASSSWSLTELADSCSYFAYTYLSEHPPIMR